MAMFRGASDRAVKCIFNLLKAFNLHERKFMVKRVIIFKMRVNKRSGDSSGGGKVKSVTNTMEVMAGARQGRNKFGKREVGVQNESEVAGGRSGRNGLCGREEK